MVMKEDGRVIGLFAVMDQLRDSSREAVEKLHNMGIKTAMLTGDNQKTAGAIAKSLGIDEVFAELMPEDKLDAVKTMKAEDKEIGRASCRERGENAGGEVAGKKKT